jgi:tetratricopeptide (TPR) repeat protein
VRLRLLIGLAALLAVLGSAAAKEDPDTEIARRHYARGLTLYEAGQYREAVAEFEAARSLRPSAAFDYNIARCYDRLEQPAEAIVAYERYLAAPTTPEDAGEVRQRIAVLRRRVPPPTAPPPVTTPTAMPPAAATDRRMGVALPVSFLVLTAASLATGGALYGVSGQRYDNLVSSGCGRTLVCTEDRYGSTQRMERAGIGLLIAGGVIAAADVVVWGLWAARRGRR